MSNFCVDDVTAKHVDTLSASPSTSVLLGLILGAMVAIDMGGPINKVAFLFGVASITAGNPMIMGAVACSVSVPPLLRACNPNSPRSKRQ